MLRLICVLLSLASVAVTAGASQSAPKAPADPAGPSRQLFIGGRGMVVAIDRASGQEIWRARLKGGDFVNVVLNDGGLYAATHGEIYCLDVATGHIRWQTPLKGFGRGLVTIAGNQQPVVLGAERQKEQQGADAGSLMVMMMVM